MTLRLGCWGAWLLAFALGASCAREIGGDPLLTDGAAGGGQQNQDDMDAAVDGGRFGNPTAPVMSYGDAGEDLDAMAVGDAFFINDPPPPYCGPDPDMHMVDEVTGTLSCPSDKNREGCPCGEVGMQAPCWPGKRANREHGICKDGVTTCVDTTEFGNRWAACEGYVLPEVGAVSGPESCGCFSSGTWRLSNLSPCILRGNSDTWLYSSILGADGMLKCEGNSEPPPVPPEVWSTSSLNIDCAGQFNLCFTIKAGKVDDPKPTDCVVHETCVDVTYLEANVDQELPDIPAWSSPDSACAEDFDTRGGYGEMSVLGESIECDEIGDGSGGRLVFHRTNYCPPSCQQRMTDPDCIGCRTGGSGDF